MLTVNGVPAAAAGSVLDACRRTGARVPAFCHDESTSPGGHCRACLVEVNGKLVAACTTRAQDGQQICTSSARLEEYRRDLGELMRAEAEPRGRVGHALQALGVNGERYARTAADPARRDHSHAYLRLDLERCILCRLCVRACAEVQGQFVFATEGRSAQARLSWGEGSFQDSDCTGCGACTEVCPTGAISDRDRERAAALVEERQVRTTCSYCGVGCQLDVHVAGGDVVRISGAPAAVNRRHLCVKGRYAHGVARHPDRITSPLLRENGRLVPVSYDEALSFIASELQRLSGRVAGLSSSRCTNEENYLMQKWLRGGLGSNDIDCCARVCHAPSAAGMRRSLGTGAATNSLADIERADLLLVAGSNTRESHPVTGARVQGAVLAGARLIVIDPRRTELAALADVHLQLRPGSNVALFNSLAAVLVEEDLVSHSFLQQRTLGWAEYREFIARYAPEQTERHTHVPAELVRRAARLYASAARPMMLHGLGMTEHYQGSEGVMALCNLALLVGAVGREGVGVNPLRGQNNVQGAADMGCQPDLLTGYADPADAEVRQRFERVWGRTLPAAAGRTLPEMYQAMRSGELAALFILGEDVVQTDPNTNQVVADLQRLELLVVQELFLTPTAELAHVVLPGASFLEKEGTFTNGERRIQRVRQVLPPHPGVRPDWQTLCDLMAATGYPQGYTHPREIMAEIAQVAPSFAGVSYERLGVDGLQWPVPSAGHRGTPLLHRESFPHGRAPLLRVEYEPSPGSAAAPGELLLITGRALEHYNNGSMTRRTPNLELCAHDALELHPDDARSLHIATGDSVSITSRFGEARATARESADVAPGTAFLTFHFPETGTNRLTSDVVDRIAGTPEYKLTPVRVSKTP